MFCLVLFSLLVAASFAASPLYQAQHYEIYNLEDIDLARRSPLVPSETLEVVDGQPRTVIEYPYNGTVSEDTGGNFGDLEFSSTVKTGTLITRDTIVNQNYNESVVVYYRRDFPGYYVEDFRAYNVGRERGGYRYGTIAHTAGYVETEIEIAAGNAVRIFVETYVRVDE